MALELAKRGSKIDLTKVNPNLKRIRVELSWDANQFQGEAFDLDASIFMAQENNKCFEEDVVFYNNLTHKSGAVKHSGDERTGARQGADEIITIDLTKMPTHVFHNNIVITIDEADRKRQNFGMVRNALVEVFDDETDSKLIRYELAEDFSSETAIQVANIYRHQGEWKFHALGQGYSEGLAGFVKMFGLDSTDSRA